jgi:cyanate permease
MGTKTDGAPPGLAEIFLAGMLLGASMGLAVSTAWHPVPWISGPGITSTVLFVLGIVLIGVAVVRARRAAR